MQIRSDRRHRFTLAPADLWDAITRVDAYSDWWPWLRGFEPDGGFREGARWRGTVQPPLPYTVRFRLQLEEVVAPRFVTASIDGDITGHAAVDIKETADGSELRLVSTLAPAHGALRAIAAIATPVVRFGHDWVLDRGINQFRRALPSDP